MASHLTISAIALTGLLASTAALSAQTSDCTKIEADAERLACYDAAAKPKEQAPVQANQDYRGRLVAGLEKQFLSVGADISVMYLEKQDKSWSAPKELKAPMLILFGYIGRPLVYQMITEAKILDMAKSVGFKSVDFFSKGGDGHYFFDIATSIPSCDIAKRVCR